MLVHVHALIPNKLYYGLIAVEEEEVEVSLLVDSLLSCVGLPFVEGAVSLELRPSESCQDGIAGFPTKLGNEGDGVEGYEGWRLRSKAFSDLSSCCNSDKDIVCDSLLFSII